MSLKVWIKAARLKTLPLAVSGVIIGNGLAYSNCSTGFNKWLFIFTFLTAVSLQILSNFANDYGDFIKGTDKNFRSDRVMSSGEMTLKQMKFSLIILGILSFLFGVISLLIGIKVFNSSLLLLLGIGLLAILAAYFYTMGKKPYGYYALGDFSVFLFFGLFAVCGSYYLQTLTINLNLFLASAGLGFLCSAVLNINNMRDIKTDLLANKITIANKLNFPWCYYYHIFTITVAFILIYFSIKSDNFNSLDLLFLLSVPFYINHLQILLKIDKDNRTLFNKQLKVLSLLIFFTSVLYVLPHLI